MALHNQLKQTYWIVGASQGIGLALVSPLLDQGHNVIASARTAETNPSLKALNTTYPQTLLCLDLDVTDSNNMHAIIRQAWAQFEGIDVWLYNAGAYRPAPIEEMKIDDFQHMNSVNYLGATAMLCAFFEQERIPKHWVWNISLASDFGLPYGGAYSAPKAALQNLAESLHPELREKNIQLQVINHGFVKTRLTQKNDFKMLGLMEPEAAAAKIIQSMSGQQFETRFPLSLSLILKTLKRLPKPISLWITKGMLKK